MPNSKELERFRAGEVDVVEEQSDEWSKDPIHSHSRSGDDTDLELHEVKPEYWETHQIFLDMLEKESDDALDKDFEGLFGTLGDLTDPQKMKIKYLICTQLDFETCR